MNKISNLNELTENELMKIEGGFKSTGEVIGYYARKVSKILDLSPSGFRDVLLKRTYYH